MSPAMVDFSKKQACRACGFSLFIAFSAPQVSGRVISASI